MIHRCGVRCLSSLKLYPALELNDPARKSAFGATEERVVNLRARAVEVEWLQIQDVEDVEEVRLDFKELPFAEKLRQAETFGEAHVHVEVARAAERVAPDAGQLEAARCSGAEEARAAAGEVAARDESV